jgi:hypothetical protein
MSKAAAKARHYRKLRERRLRQIREMSQRLCLREPFNNHKGERHDRTSNSN